MLGTFCIDFFPNIISTGSFGYSAAIRIGYIASTPSIFTFPVSPVILKRPSLYSTLAPLPTALVMAAEVLTAHAFANVVVLP